MVFRVNSKLFEREGRKAKGPVIVLLLMAASYRKETFFVAKTQGY